MNFKKEVRDFEKTNGNNNYTQRDMLKFLCNKTEKQSEAISKIQISLGEGKIKFKWLRGTDAIYFTFFCGLLYLILTLHGIL